MEKLSDQNIAEAYSLPHVINRFLEDNSPPRKMLLSETLSCGQIAIYGVPDGRVAYMEKRDLFKTERFPKINYKGELSNDLFLPYVEYSDRMTFTNSGGLNGTRAYHLAKRFAQFETNTFVELLMRSVPDQVSTGEPCSALLNSAFRHVEQHDLCVHSLVMTVDTAKKLVKSDPKTLGNILKERNLWTADIHFVEHSKMDGKVFCLSARDNNGAIYQRESPTSWGPDHNGESHVWYSIGMMITEFSVSCAEFTDCDYRVEAFYPQYDAEIRVGKQFAKIYGNLG